MNLLFSIPNLNWDHPTQHVETFSGAMEVTKHEWMDGRWRNIVFKKGLVGVVFLILNSGDLHIFP